MSGTASITALAVYALLLTGPVPALLRRAAWATRAPCLATGLWLALSVSWLMALVLAGLKPAAVWLAQPGRLAA